MPPLRTALRTQHTEGIAAAFHGAFQAAQRLRRRVVRKTTPSATIAAVEISGAGAATAPDSRLEKAIPLKPPSRFGVTPKAKSAECGENSSKAARRTPTGVASLTVRHVSQPSPARCAPAGQSPSPQRAK